MDLNSTELDIDQLPWIVFELNDHSYAISTKYVAGITMLPDDIVPLPGAERFFRGMAQLRNRVVPLLGLRGLFAMPTVAEEYQEFKNMIDQRKIDHEKWVKELIRCVDENDTFKLATDPHKCAFGKWYDSFKTENNIIKNHLKRIEQPHKDLHAVAVETMACQRDCENCKREECLRVLLKRASEDYMPRVLQLLEEAKDIFKNHYREIIILLSDEKHNDIGLIVDEVLAVDQLEIVCGRNELNRLYQSEYVLGVAQSERIHGQIITLEEERLLELGKDVKLDT